jgi:ribosomal protein L16 Arg81 hydroxylase
VKRWDWLNGESTRGPSGEIPGWNPVGPIFYLASFWLVHPQFRVGFLRWLRIHHGHALLPNVQVRADFQSATATSFTRETWNVLRDEVKDDHWGNANDRSTLKSSDAENWMRAIQEVLKSLEQMETWDVEDRIEVARDAKGFEVSKPVTVCPQDKMEETVFADIR